MQYAQNIENVYCYAKMIGVIDKKQIHDSVATVKENACKGWNCTISMFLMNFNVFFVCGCACFMCICRKNWYRAFFGTRSGFF